MFSPRVCCPLTCSPSTEKLPYLCSVVVNFNSWKVFSGNCEQLWNYELWLFYKYSQEIVDFLLILEALYLLLVSVESSVLPPVGLHRRSQIHYENKRVERRTKETKEEHGKSREENMVYLQSLVCYLVAMLLYLVYLQSLVCYHVALGIVLAPLVVKRMGKLMTHHHTHGT